MRTLKQVLRELPADHRKRIEKRARDLIADEEIKAVIRRNHAAVKRRAK